jgi:diacylglycerol O-acyltransferase
VPNRPLTSVDTAWWRMEDPTNLMMITGVMVLGAPVDFERLKATFQHGLLGFDRFRQRIVRSACGRYYWEEDPELDIGYHVQRASLPEPGDQMALQELASVMASTQLDLSRPLWQIHLVNNYGGGSALICRLHHCIGDGLALVHVLLSLTDSGPDTPWPMPEPELSEPGRPRSLGKIARTGRQAVKLGVGYTGRLIHLFTSPLGEPTRILDGARLGANCAKSTARLLLLWPDPKTTFKGPLGVRKRAAWSAPIPLKDVKVAGAGLGGTVNDMLLTAMSGALRRYLLARGEPVEGLNFRAVVPVNLRKPDTEEELGNKFGLVFLSLPIGIAKSGSRLTELRRRMDSLKDSMEAPVAFGILNAIGASPSPIQDIVVSIFGAKGTAVMTNVMGPKEKRYLAGVPLEAIMFWVPQSGHLGMGVSILSYAGKVWMGVITDETLVPDPEVIIAAFHAEFDELKKASKQFGDTDSLKEATARLDQALSTLDGMLEESASEPEHLPSDGPMQCQALTKAGRQCRNRALAGSDYCHVHSQN